MKPGRLCTPFFVLLLTISATVFAQSQLTLDPIQHATSPSTDIARLRTEADQGNAAAQNNLGVVYANGTGVAKDPAQAVFWYRKAADQGDAAAQNNLGVAYANGTGIGKDVVQAVVWYRKAADQGHAIAQSNLGDMFRDGTGIGKDMVQAVVWYRKAADQGCDAAQNNLGVMYAMGAGVPQDMVAAYMWADLAAEASDRSHEFRKALESHMTKDQVDEGKRLSREWLAKHAQPTDGSETRTAPADLHLRGSSSISN